MGTPEFARVILERLHSEEYPILGVFAQPDKPVGRGRKMQSPPVAQFAKDHSLPLFQPTSVKGDDVLEQIEALQPDFIVVAAYGKLLPERLLQAAKIDCINVHASLLPKYRGAAPINYCLLDGEDKTGVAIMSMVPALDAGPVYSDKEILIADEDDAVTLTQKLSVLGAEALIEALPKIATGELTSQPQDENKVTFARKLSKEMSDIDWQKSAREIFNQVRALKPWPIAQTHVHGARVRVFDTQALETTSDGKPGEIVHISKLGLTIATGKGDLMIAEAQVDGKKRMPASDVANGLRLKVGDQFS